jgi:hypothetical protein
MSEDDAGERAPSITEQLASMREAAQALKLRREAQSQERELEALKLEAKYETELGARGVKFDIVSNALGSVVVRLGDSVAYKRFLKVPDTERTEEDAAALVTPYVVYPTRAEYLSMATSHGGVHWQCALAMLQLYEAKGTQTAGK